MSLPQSAAAPPQYEVLLLQRELALGERELALLRAALDAAAAREQMALEREALLLRLLEQAQAQSHRLLDVARPPAALPAAPSQVPAPRATAENLQAAVPPFDATRYALGKLCPRQHDYQGTGQSLRRLPRFVCLECDAERARERRQTQREGPRREE